MLRGDLLSFRRVKKLQVGLGSLARSPGCRHLFDDCHGRFGQNADRRIHDLGLVFSGLARAR